ncbi:MAG: acylphosphatase, partial [Methanotrichaceae archaeon]|nr:acylphosphatase [Methanotrichaceae archaeon]
MMRLLAFVSGKVQRAGYRARIVSLAKALDLTGTVQNLEDGRVKVLAEGDEADLWRLQKGLKVKNHIIDVTSVEASYSQASGDYEDFFKLVGSGETDERLDTGIEYLKKLIVVNEKGFQTLGEKVDCVGGKVVEVGRKVDCVGEKVAEVGR